MLGLWTTLLQIRAWPPTLAPHFPTPAHWQRFVQDTRRRTAERLAAGERDHLAFFVLQSREFTSVAPVPPVPSADLTLVRTRVRDFLRYQPRTPNERFTWLRRLPSAADPETLFAACRAAVESTDPSRPDFYLTRGLSSDSEVESSFALQIALATARELSSATPSLRDVLLLGPGLDWAPRTNFRDRPPQSHQPLAVLDALLRRRWAARGEIRLTAFDVNPRVVHFLPRLPREWMPDLRISDPDLAAYAASLGDQLGRRRQGVIALDPWVRAAIIPHLGNIILEPPPRDFDLAIATNVLLYFTPLERTLAFHWLRSRARPDAWFIHNDPRPEVEAEARSTGWTPRLVRRLALRGGLEDSFSLLQPAAAPA